MKNIIKHIILSLFILLTLNTFSQSTFLEKKFKEIQNDTSSIPTKFKSYWYNRINNIENKTPISENHSTITKRHSTLTEKQVSVRTNVAQSIVWSFSFLAAYIYIRKDPVDRNPSSY